jgi:hypothetical protein
MPISMRIYCCYCVRDRTRIPHRLKRITTTINTSKGVREETPMFCSGFCARKRKERKKNSNLFEPSEITSLASCNESSAASEPTQPPVLGDITVKNLFLRATYRMVSRLQCPLLEACWRQDWYTAHARLSKRPNEAFSMSITTGRTALHFATIPSVASCPIALMHLLVQTNPHATTVRDTFDGSTPLHFLVTNASTRDDPVLVELFVATARRLATSRSNVSCRLDYCRDPPLYLAAQRNACPATLHALIFCSASTRNRDPLAQQQQQRDWISPWTGGERFQQWQQPQQLGHALVKCPTTSHRPQSPLRELWSDPVSSFDFLRVLDQENDIDDSILSRLRELTVIALDNYPSFHLLLRQGAKRHERRHVAEEKEEEYYHDALVSFWLQSLVLLQCKCPSATLVHHCSCLASPIPNLLLASCRLFPNQLAEKDENDCLPLHRALHRCSTTVCRDLCCRDENDDCLKCVQVLVQCHPDSVTAVDPYTGMYPTFAMACRSNGAECVYLLLRLAPQVIQLQQQYLDKCGHVRFGSKTST